MRRGAASGVAFGRLANSPTAARAPSFSYEGKGAYLHRLANHMLDNLCRMVFIGRVRRDHQTVPRALAHACHAASLTHARYTGGREGGVAHLP